MCACAGISGQQISINIPLFTFIHRLLSLTHYAPDTRSSVLKYLTHYPDPGSLLYLVHLIHGKWAFLCVSLSAKLYIRYLSRDTNPLSHDPEALRWTKHVDQTSASGLYDENDQYNEHIPCVVVVCSGLTSLSTIFQSYHDVVLLQQGAQCSLLLCCVIEVSYPRHLT